MDALPRDDCIQEQPEIGDFYVMKKCPENDISGKLLFLYFSGSICIIFFLILTELAVSTVDIKENSLRKEVIKKKKAKWLFLVGGEPSLQYDTCRIGIPHFAFLQCKNCSVLLLLQFAVCYLHSHTM